MITVAQTIANLDAWFETIRTPEGYGGPVVHWWQNCLQYTGAGLDWRYEGMIIGYLTLWRRTRETAWLEKATRCGMSLVKGLQKDGNFRNSSFELNPYAGGTPHEAAVDIGLLHLAFALRGLQDSRWKLFAKAAERNLKYFYLKRLWHKKYGRFQDSPTGNSFVPNQACTVVEALFEWAELRQRASIIEKYALPTLEAVINLQATEGVVEGGIAQSQHNGKTVEAYFPYYVARCVPALVRAFEYSEEHRWIDAAERAYGFVMRAMDEEGFLPQVVYPNGRNAFPRWVAPLGDVLRIGELLAGYGLRFNLNPMKQQLIKGQLLSGGFVTGHGFGGQVSQRKTHQADFRDFIPVAGWNDKAFRFFAGCLPDKMTIPVPKISNWQTTCQVRGKTAVWQETKHEMKLTVGKKTLYQWQKGQPWAAVSTPEVLWK